MRAAILLPLGLMFAAPAMAQLAPASSAPPGTNFTDFNSFFGLPYSVVTTPAPGIDTGPQGARVQPLDAARAMIAAGQYRQADAYLGQVAGHASGLQRNEVRFLRGVASLGEGDAARASGLFKSVVLSQGYRHAGAMSGLALAQIKLGDKAGARDILARLKTQQARCDAGCGRAASIDQAVSVVEKALI